MSDLNTKIAESQAVLMEEFYLPAFTRRAIEKAAQAGIPVNGEQDILALMEVAAAIKQAEANGDIQPQTNVSPIAQAAKSIKTASTKKAAPSDRALTALDNWFSAIVESNTPQ